MAPQQKLFLAVLSILVVIAGIYSIFWGPLSKPAPKRVPVPTEAVEETSPVDDLIQEFESLQQNNQEESYTAIQEIYDAVGAGENLTCAFKNNVLNADVKMKGPLIYAEFNSAESAIPSATGSAQAEDVKTFILVQEEYTYLWSTDDSQDPTKIPSGTVNPDALLSLSEVGSKETVADIAQESCTAAQTPDSYFQPPAGLEFVEVEGGFGL